MTDQHHPITPPPELVEQWIEKIRVDQFWDAEELARLASQYGADQELEACCTEVSFWGSKSMADKLRAARNLRKTMTEKPEFPKPRLIREDFLPYESMKNYRIKKVIEHNITWYYPQVKVLWWWINLDYYTGFLSLEEAQKALCYRIKGNVVEYIEFDPEVDCK